MKIRKPVVAGQFYSGSNAACLAEVHQCIDDGGSFIHDLPHSIAGGIVPHAGWIFSGDLAGAVFSAIKRANGDADTFVPFQNAITTQSALLNNGAAYVDMNGTYVYQTLSATYLEGETYRLSVWATTGQDYEGQQVSIYFRADANETDIAESGALDIPMSSGGTHDWYPYSLKVNWV